MEKTKRGKKPTCVGVRGFKRTKIRVLFGLFVSSWLLDICRGIFIVAHVSHECPFLLVHEV